MDYSGKNNMQVCKNVALWMLGLHRKFKHGGVVGGVGDEGEHFKLRNEDFT